ncbi:MAG: hypothetical protein ACLT1X_03195 [Christensenellales bacterium]
MNANAIQEKILSDARTSASDIMRDANEKAARLRDAAEKADGCCAQPPDDAGFEDAEVARLRMERMEELEERKRRSATSALIDEAFAQALDKLEAMPPQQARAFLMTEAAAVADGDETVILGSKNPGWFDDKFLADLNTMLQKQGKPGQLTLGEEKRDGETGLILAKNGMEISCTFASLLDSRRLDMEADIVAILFPDRPA